jgi:ubiquinone/menaquinone biosynthesis C-methylase UbiE
LTTADNLTEARRLIRLGWEEVATEYARDRLGVFGQFAGRLLELLRPSAGSGLLDVGCGSGAVALRAPAWVGPEGWVVASDFAAAMVHLGSEAARQEAAAITFCLMDAELLGFASASFDAVTCAFSLFQFPDMPQALAEMQRVLKPGGRLALSNWGPGYFSPIAALQRDLFREFNIAPLLTNPITFKPDTLHTLLREAGFTAIELIEEASEVWIENPEEAWAFNLDMGPFPVMLRQQLTGEQQEELVYRFMAMLEDLNTEHGIGCTFHPLYALAKKGETI